MKKVLLSIIIGSCFLNSLYADQSIKEDAFDEEEYKRNLYLSAEILEDIKSENEQIRKVVKQWLRNFLFRKSTGESWEVLVTLYKEFYE